MFSKGCLCLVGLGLLSACGAAPSPPEVVVLGFDGAGYDTLAPLMEAGKLPFLQELAERGYFGPLETFKPTKSPVIWTSIATGKSMEKHGILDFVYMEENDVQVPYSNSERREPSIWQILDAAGKRSVVVNWFVTHPPDAIDGVMVSNRFRRTLLVGRDRWPRMHDTVHPPERFAELAELVDLRYDDLRKERGLPDLLAGGGEADTAPVLKDYPVFVMQEALVENVARHLYRSETGRFDFFAAYFRLPDIVQHSAVHLVDPSDPEAFEAGVLDLLEPFYRDMERIVRSYVNEPGHEETTFVIVSDHGFAYNEGFYDHYRVPDDEPPPRGIFFMVGPSVEPAESSSVQVSVYDIAPTLLQVYGLPVGEEMDGEPIEALLTGESEVRYARYGPELMGGEKDSDRDELDEELDQKTLEELKALGYIQ